MDEKIVLRSWHSPDFINRELFRLCVKLRERSCRFEIDDESFSLIVSFLRSSDHERLSATISLLDTTCQNKVYREQFLQSESGVKNLMHVLDSCTDSGVLCKAWKLIGSFLNWCWGDKILLKLLMDELCQRFHQLLNVETLGNMCPDVRDCVAPALELYLRKVETSSFLGKLVNLLKCEDCDILQFTLHILKVSPYLTDEAVYVLIALIQHDEPIIGETAVTLLLEKSHQIARYPQAATAVLDYLEMNPQYLNDLAVRGMANLTVEESVREKLKHSGVLEKILFYGLEKGIIETADMLMNFKNDQDVIDLCAKDITVLKLLIEVVILRGGPYEILNMIMSSSKINRDIASCASLKMFLGELRYYIVLEAILRSNQLTKEILLSGLCWAIQKADCNLQTYMDTSSTFGVAKTLLCEPENKRIVMLSLPFIIYEDEVDFWKEYLMDLGGLNFLMTELETNPTDDAVAYALFIICQHVRFTIGKENFPVRMKCCIQKRETWSLVQRSSQIHRLPTCGEPSGETVTISVDDGEQVHWDRHQLSKISPVFDAMLNGSFIEARQDHVQFPDCSAAALTALLNMVTGKCKIDDISVGIRLQLAELAERLLIPGLGHTVALSFQVNTENIVDLYEWFWNRGYLIDSMWTRYIGQQVYDILFLYCDYFQRVLRNEPTRELLISDMKEFLQNVTNNLTQN